MKYINEPSLHPNTGYLVLVRHGQSMGNAWEEAYRNSEMNFLTELGQTQAKLAGLKLNQTGMRFDHMYCSGMLRARHTLAILAHTLDDWRREFLVDERFNEKIPTESIFAAGERETPENEHHDRVVEGYEIMILPSLKSGQNVLLVSHYYTMKVLFKHLGVRLDKLWGSADHIPNAVPFIWDLDQPERMIVLNDETRVPSY